MRRNVTQRNGVLALVCLITLSAAQLSSDVWNVTKAFKPRKGTDPVLVKSLPYTDKYVSLTYQIPQSQAKKSTSPMYHGFNDQLMIASAPLTSIEGEPRMPVLPIKVAIPFGYTVDAKNITVTFSRKYDLDGKYTIEYANACYPLLPDVKIEKAKPKAEVYGSDNPYPAKQYELVTVQKKQGVTIAHINLFPVTYYPKSGRVRGYSMVSCRIGLKRQPFHAIAKESGLSQLLNERSIGVDNPEVFYSYGAKAIKNNPHTRGWCNPADSYQYILITNIALRDATTDVTVRDLITHRQARGQSATIVTIEDIYSNYTGVDNAEKLRNFIIDAYSNWETEYVLLGGDINIIPLRYLYADGENIPSDLYYQCLDGNYNNDGDSYWGESTDGPGGTDIDLMAEVYIGRASAENPTEMSHFVHKTLAYENEAESAPYLHTALMCGEYLGFGGVSEYATASMEEIRLGSSTHGYVTAGFSACPAIMVDTLYDRSGYSWPMTEIINDINSNNYSVINHLGHANTNYVMKFYNADADALTNNNFLFAYSQGCIPGDFSADCIAEHLTTSNRHGMYAVVFNSRYGWGQFSSTDGPSQRFDRQFWDAYFGEYMFTLGALNADSHEDNIWDINGENIRWCYYETNLQGDPAVFMRGQVTGPSLAYASHVISDQTGGNNDHLINPGEQIGIKPRVVNVGSDPAIGVSATISTTDGFITILKNNVLFGDVPGMSGSRESQDSFSVRISPSCPTPHTATLSMAMNDNASGVWNSDFSITVYTSSQLSGAVTTFTGGNPVAGAVVEYLGPLNGSVSTNSSGLYMFGGIDGDYHVYAKHPDFLSSDTLTVTIPPNASNVNFALKRPVLTITPQTVRDSIAIGDSIVTTVLVSNTGDAALLFSASFIDNTASLAVPAEKLYDPSHFVSLEKGEQDNRLGLPVNLGKGGPDQFGYSWKDSDEPGGPQFTWRDISGIGQILSTVSGCDDCFQAQRISFSFPFYGTEFDTIYVSSNGFITFGTGSSLISNYPLPSASAPPNLIDALHDDLHPGSAGDIYFLNEAHQVTVQFNNVAAYDGSGNYTFQIVLEDNGLITLYYRTLTGTLNGCTVGIQNGTRTDGLTVAYNTTYLKNNLAVRLRFTPDWLRPGVLSGIVNPGTSIVIPITLDATELSGGSHTGSLLFDHNDPVAADPFTLPCTLYVDGVRRLSVTPVNFDYGNVRIGAYDTVAFTLANSGDEPTTINGLISNNPVFAHIASLPVLVPPFSAETLSVVFHPVTIGGQNGTITINSNAEDNPELSITMSGNGVPAPQIRVVPGQFHETLDGGDSVTRTMSITNSGGDNLFVHLTIQKTVQSERERQLHNGATIFQKLTNIQNVFKNESTTSWTGDNVKNIEIAVPVNRTGEKVLIIRDALPWGYNVNEPLLISLGAIVTIITSSQIAATDFSIYDLILIPSVQSSTFYSNYHAQRSKFESYLGSGGIMQFHCATQSTQITLPGNVQAVFETSSTNYVVDNLHPVANSVPSVLTGSSASHNYFTGLLPNTKIIIQDDQSRPTLIEYTYGNGTVLATGMTWEFYYPSGLGNPLLPNAIAYTLGGANSGNWLYINIASDTIEPGNSTEMSVKFKAEKLSSGDHFSTIVINHNATNEPTPVQIVCTLTVNGYRSLTAAPSSIDFGNAWLGKTDTATLVLINNGNEPTVISSIVSTNPPFTHNASIPLTVPAFGSTQIPVRFSPVVVGNQSGTLTVTSDAQDNPSLSVQLQGTGIVGPQIAVTPSFVKRQLAMADSVFDTVSVSNSGDDNLTFSIQTITNSIYSWIRTTLFSGTVLPAQTAKVPVVMNARQIPAALYQGRVVVSHNVSGQAAVNVPCTLTVLSQRRISAIPALLDFGNVALGRDSMRTLTVQNSGNDTTTITTIACNNPVFSHTATLPLKVPPFSTRTITARFTPTGMGLENGTLSISSNASDNPMLSVAVQGTGIVPASIDVTPLSYNETATAGSVRTADLIITNSGGLPLQYSISSSSVLAKDNTYVYGPEHFIELAKGEPDTRVGQEVTLGSGGPDSFGYRWVDSDVAGGPVYIWNDIKTTGSLLSTVSNCDDCYESKAFSFSFPYYGTNFSSVYICSNGYITFGSASSQYSNSPLPSTSMPANLIAAFFDDLSTSGVGEVYFQDFGNRVIVQFEKVALLSGGGEFTFQIVFHSDGAINLYYKTISGTSTSCTAGIQNSSRTVGLQMVYNATYLKNNLAVDIRTSPRWLNVAPAQGTVSAGSSLTATVTFDATQLIGGNFRGRLSIAHNDPAKPNPFIVPCTLRVDGISRLSVSPLQADFGNVWVGNSRSETVTLTNAGTDTTTVNSINVDNTLFTYNAVTPLRIGPTRTSTFTVTYAPDQIGNHAGTVTILSNAEDNPTLTVQLDGAGAQPPHAQLAPTSLVYNLQPNDAPADQTSVLSNTGGDILAYEVKAVRQTGSPLIRSLQNSYNTIPLVNAEELYNPRNYLNPYVPGQVIAALQPGLNTFANTGLLSSLGAESVRELAVAKSPLTKKTVYTGRKLFLITINDKSAGGVISAIEKLRTDTNLAYAQPNFIYKAIAVPNDASFGLLYGMHNTGQTGGTVDADIDAVEAWDQHTGNRTTVRIGVIDTGIDYLHPDLAANMWRNPGETAGNGIDDDGNGFIDDIYGWDFAYDDSDPRDGHYHGTHCAGTIAGVGNNGVGVAGVMWEAQLIAIKFLDDGGSGNTADAIDAVNYAAAMDIHITSNSWGGGSFDQGLYDAIAAGGLFVAAAGNSSSNNDASPHYPSSYTCPNIIAVAATDNRDNLASFSCYGPTSVDLGAPGVQIYSCAPGNSYQYLDGTSMATPHVSGAAGLVWSYNPMLTALEVKQLLLGSIDTVAALRGRVLTSGRLNVDKALAAAGPSWLSVTPTTPGTVNPSEYRNFSVSVDPSGLAAGQWQGEVVLGTNDPLNTELTVFVTANIAGCRSLVSQPASLLFDDTWAGAQDTMKLSLINDCNDAVTVFGMTIDNPNFSTSSSAPIVILPFSRIESIVIFRPADMGNHTGFLTIQSNADDNPVISVSLSGIATVPPRITVSPLQFTKRLPVGGVTLDELIISNPGGAALTYEISGSGDASIMINEFCNNPDFIELWNLGSDQTMNGWQIRMVDDAGSTGTFSFPAGYVFRSGRRLVLRESTGTVNDSTFYYGVNIGWVEGSQVALSLLDNSGRGIDFVRTTGSVEPPPAGTAWNGGGVNFSLYDAARSSNEDTDGLSDWTTGSSYSEYRLNPGQSDNGIWPSWLSVSKSSGTVPPSQTDDVGLTFNATGLSEQTYTAYIILEHNVPGQPSINIPLTLYVGQSVTGVSQIRYIGPSASAAAYGNKYAIEEIIIGSPTSGNVTGTKHTLKLK